MIKFFYYCYNIKSNSTSIIGKIARKLTLHISAILLPFYFYFLRTYFLKKLNTKNDGITITFTSFPKRINKVYQVVISLMIQNCDIKEIILYLSKEQFSTLEVLPKSLKDLIPLGLRVILVDDDMRSYKKYIYNKELIGDNDFVIVDDDIIYHPETISILSKAKKEFPNHIYANRCVKLESGKKYYDLKLADTRGIGTYMATGCAGVYYPANTLHPIAFDLKDAWENCPDGDDIWLKASAQMGKTEIFFTGFSLFLLPVYNRNSDDLHIKNVQNSGNDRNIFKVKDFFSKKYNEKVII